MQRDQSNSGVVCPLCGAQLRRLIRDGRLGAHRRGDREEPCPARGWKPGYVQDLIARDDVADVEAVLRMTQSDQSTSPPRCMECGAALARWDEPHTIEDCRGYLELSPADQDAYEEAVRIIRIVRAAAELSR